MKIIRAILENRRLPFLAAVLAALLTSPSLNNGFVLDDYFHRAAMLGSEHLGGFIGGAQEMFRFFRGDPERTGKAMDIGLLPWWTYPNIKAEFFQLLTVQTHVLDYATWPNSPFGMHFHSLLWLATLTLLVGILFRRILGPTWVAGLATLLFAVEDGHASPAGWIANRNVLLAATFGVSCILAHNCWAGERKPRWYILALVFWAASLCSKEAGIATSAFVFAYVVWLQKDSLRSKFLTLLPYGVVLVVWRIIRDGLGYGVHGIGLYVDPLDDPSRFFAALVERAPALMSGQWVFPPSDVFGVLPSSISWPLWRSAVILLAILTALFWPLLRTDRVARFFATAMLLALVPICATSPMDRLLVFVGIGAFGLLARFVEFAFSSDRSVQFIPSYRAVARFGAGSLLVIHLAVAPFALLYRAANPLGPSELMASFSLPATLPEEIADQDLIVINPPSPMHVGYRMITGEFEHQPVPKRLRCLATGVTKMTVRREDERTIVIQPDAGFMPMILSRLVRNSRHSMSVGETVELTGMQVEVLQLTADGEPALARFVFDVPLEHSSLRWLRWREGQFEPFVPPPIGEETILDALPLRRLLTGDYRP